MEKFREKIKKEVRFLAVFFALQPLLMILLNRIAPKYPNSIAPDFITGFMMGGILVALLYFGRRVRALKNEEELKKLYIVENDERNIAIKANAGSTGILIILVGFSVAMLIASGIEKIVFFTLLGSTLFVALVMALTKIYYKKTM